MRKSQGRPRAAGQHLAEHQRGHEGHQEGRPRAAQPFPGPVHAHRTQLAEAQRGHGAIGADRGNRRPHGSQPRHQDQHSRRDGDAEGRVHQVEGGPPQEQHVLGEPGVAADRMRDDEQAQEHGPALEAGTEQGEPERRADRESGRDEERSRQHPSCDVAETERSSSPRPFPWAVARACRKGASAAKRTLRVRPASSAAAPYTPSVARSRPGARPTNAPSTSRSSRCIARLTRPVAAASTESGKRAGAFAWLGTGLAGSAAPSRSAPRARSQAAPAAAAKPTIAASTAVSIAPRRPGNRTTRRPRALRSWRRSGAGRRTARRAP